MTVNNQESLHFFSTKPTRFFPAAVLATIAVVVFYYWHTQVAAPLPPTDQISGFFNVTSLRFKLFASGPIPYAIAWTFVFGVAYLGQIWMKKIVPLNFSSNIADGKVVRAAMSGNDIDLVNSLNEQLKSGVYGYYGTRLLKLRKRYMDKDIAAVIALKNDILEVDEEEFSLSFTSVMWCEAALPLLGFLGTVVGIGGALGGIQNAVLLLFNKTEGAGANLNQQVVVMFGRGFQDLAVAFDTTFLGLMGLIILGILHNYVKKHLAIQLARAREVFRDVVANWTGDGANPTVVAIGGLDNRLYALQDAVHGLEATLLAAEERAIFFRENLKEMAERVILEDDHLRSVRNVLFRPFVEFRQAEREFTARVEDTLDQRFAGGTWRLTGIAASLADPRTVAIAVCHDRGKKTDHHVYLFDIEGKNEDIIHKVDRAVARPIMAYPPAGILAQSDEGELVAIGEDGTAAIGEKALKPDDLALPMQYDARDAALIIRNQGHAFSTRLIDVSMRNAIGPGRQLSLDASWTVWCLHVPSSTLMMAGKSRNDGQENWLLQLIPLGPVQKSEKRETAAESEPIQVELPGEIIPRQIIGLSAGELAILDTGGALHYWETKRLSPVRLSHPAWDTDPQCVVRPGKNGWIAVAAKERLKMWRIRNGGFLHPYDRDQEGFAITALASPETLVATADGRYLLGLTEKMIIAWEFPQFTQEQM